MEMKFRGIDIKTGEMVFGGGIDSQRDTPIIINHGERYFVDAKTVGQYTGLKDTNGIEMFTGDVLIMKGRFEQNKEITFHNGTFGVKTNNHYRDGVCALSALVSFNRKYQVIGNIHQNPELLES
ncbi:hypothetical protein NVP1181O_55 [Vibrio phage 1.181.O._10N.286.46.C9]|nr:hypothetical protein NVP1181O_55 [Vibrio phage 1.181.O._10N.286.46.C9]